MKIKTSELTGPALDWAVTKCEGHTLNQAFLTGHHCYPSGLWEPSCDWSQGGSIIEREKIATDWDHDCWNASTDGHPVYYSGPTPLIAAMRCYVASKLGDEVEVPDELA